MSIEALETQKKREEVVARIQEQFPNIEFPKPVLEPIFYGRFDKTEVMSKKLILDKRTGTQFDVVSDRYEMVYHEEVLNELLSSIPEEFGKPNIIINFFKSGARANFYARFPELKQFEINGSPTEPEFCLRNSYDRSGFLSYSYGVRELICSNGLRAFRQKDQGAAKHIGKKINEFQLTEKLRGSLETLSEQISLYENWSKKQLSNIEIKEIIGNLPYSEKEQEKMFSLPILNHQGESLESLGEKASLWTVMSAATQMVKEIGSEERQVDLEEKIPGVIHNAADRLAA